MFVNVLKAALAGAEIRMQRCDLFLMVWHDLVTEINNPGWLFPQPKYQDFVRNLRRPVSVKAPF